MKLNILTSRKGTRVIRATELHRALGLLDHHYQANVRAWLKDVYEFQDGIRRPEGLKDYARHPNTKANVVQEYYLQVEFAKLIALCSKSKVKQAIACKLAKEADVYPENVQLSTTETLELLEQTKALARMSLQKAAEQRHLAYYTHRRGSGDYWNRFRKEQVVLATMDEMKAELARREETISSRHGLRDLLLRIDAYELIRIGIVDHYAAQGHSLPYCQQLGGLAKELAKQLKLDIVDDRKGSTLFSPVVDEEVMRRMGVAA